MVPFQYYFLQALEFYFKFLWTLLYDCFLDLIFPSFPVTRFWFLLFFGLFFGLFYFSLCILRFAILFLVFLWGCILAPVFIHFADTAGMCFVIGSPESLWAVDTYQGCRSASAHDMLVALGLFESDITVFADKSDHIVVVEIL